jgi:Mg2+ and Co2+ transporter CorA
MDYKLMIEQLKDKNKHIEDVLSNAEQSKLMEVKQMEQRIESRVAKIVL